MSYTKTRSAAWCVALMLSCQLQKLGRMLEMRLKALPMKILTETRLTTDNYQLSKRTDLSLR